MAKTDHSGQRKGKNRNVTIFPDFIAARQKYNAMQDRSTMPLYK